MKHFKTLAAGMVAAGIAAAAFFLSGLLTSEAVQNPRISLDMVTSGNTYDETTNTMTLGPIDNCLTSAAANTATHTHPTHLVIQDVEDLVGWQARLNYVGDKLRPQVFTHTPFTDNNLGQAVGFLNLPIDQTSGVHRGVIPAQTIPLAPPDDTNMPQTALFGAAYEGNQNFPVSADTPVKAVPDDASYDAPTGGVLGSLVLQVLGNESGQPSLFMNLDDNSPNPPGSTVVVFNGAGTTSINLTPSQLGDGFHGEGATCVPLDCTSQECPGATPSPSPSPTMSPSPTASPGAGQPHIGENSCQGQDACTGITADVGDNSCNGPEACFHSNAPIGDGSCNGSAACLQNIDFIGNESCNGLAACSFNRGLIGDRSCNGGNACLAQSASVGDGSCNGIFTCGFNRGTVGDGSCNIGGCSVNTGEVGNQSCNGGGTCSGNNGVVGDGSCDGDFACTGNRGVIEKDSCNEFNACSGNSGSVGKESCNGRDACRGNRSSLGKKSCNGEDACTGNRGTIGDKQCNAFQACRFNTGNIP